MDRTVIKNINFRFNLYTFIYQKVLIKVVWLIRYHLLLLKNIKRNILFKKENNLILKIIRKILQKNFFKRISELIHDTKYLKLKLSIKEKEKIDIILAEFGNYSFWLNSFKKMRSQK